MLAHASSTQSSTDRSSFSAGNWLSSISYRSRATSPLSDSDLDDLVRTAQIRNRAESITGMVIYDDGHFMQWLEGPAHNLGRIVESINRDKRHTDIEILGKEITPVRMFEGWDLRLACKSSSLPFLTQSTRVFDDVVRRSDAEQTSELKGQGSRWPIDGLRRHSEATAQALELADRLLTDGASVPDYISGVATRFESPAILFRDLFEPAARVLGDFWTDDTCTEFDVTIALVQLQTELRRLNCCATRPFRPAPRRILAVPQPGEPHMLSAVLNAEILWQAGWSVVCEFPQTDGALQALLANDHFDALDLSLSPALCRRHRLQSFAETISGARAASLNPGLAIIASGRVFGEPNHPEISIGADAESHTSFGIESAITRAIDCRRQVGWA